VSKIQRSVDVVIPVYKPGTSFPELLKKLAGQSLPVRRLIIMKTVYPGMAEIDLSAFPGAAVLEVPRDEFDHGGTRHRGMLASDADLVLFLTQDAEPCDGSLVERLADSFSDASVAVAYGRQLPKDDCRQVERLTRDFNYPAQSRKKTLADLPELGIKTFFCSDVCAMYDREKYMSLGGFEKHTIFNEDMIFAHKALSAGYAVTYRADVEVKHSHNYTGREQLRRNFDMGVSQADHPEVFSHTSSESEGLKLVKKTAGRLRKAGKWYLIPEMVYMSGMKYLGYQLGKHYKKLSEKAVLKLTMNRAYWRK